MNKKIACIGARDTPLNILDEIEEIGYLLSMNGYIIATGNAKGADEYFAKGANKINSGNVILYLPWVGLNNELVKDGNKIEIWGDILDFDNIIQSIHKSWNKIKEYAKKLHRRNYGIIKDSLCVICYTIDGTDRGGTGIGIRLARLFNIPVYNLYFKESKTAVLKFLKIQ